MIGRIKSNKVNIFVILLLVSSCSVAICTMVMNAPKNHSADTSSHSSDQTKINSLFGYEIIHNNVKITQYLGNEQTVVVPEQIGGKPVTVIGDDAFYQRKQMTSVVLPESLTTIEGSAFYRCYSLTEIFIPKNVSAVGANPFFRCSSLKKIEVDPNNAYYMDEDGVLFNKDQTEIIAYPEEKQVEKYIIPKSVKRIATDAFGYHCRHLKYLAVSSNLTGFPDYNMFVYPDDITFIVEAGSAAERYAVENELHYEIVQSVG